ncbi:MAG: hypothetical protein WBB69_15990 [Anaerolineales bacterium]
MKRLSRSVILIISSLVILSACLPITPVSSGLSNEAMIQTAIAQTQAADDARAAAESLYNTGTPDGTPNGTPDGTSGGTLEGSLTPEEAGVLDVEPTLENPWMLQSWCIDHMEGCVIYEVQNRTDSWLQVELKQTDTGVTRFFTIQSKTIGNITLIPGQYSVKYTWWCKGIVGSLTTVKAIGSWRDVFRCPGGFSGRVDKK